MGKNSLCFFFYIIFNMIRFFLIVNRSCQTRFARYYQGTIVQDKPTFELEIARQCITRRQNQVKLLLPNGKWLSIPTHYSQTLFFSINQDKIGRSTHPIEKPRILNRSPPVFRVYASLYFIIGCDPEDVSENKIYLQPSRSE